MCVVPPTAVFVDILSLPRIAGPPTQFFVAFLDISIFLLQATLLCITFETAHYHPEMEDPLAPSPVYELDGTSMFWAPSLEILTMGIEHGDPIEPPPSNDPSQRPVFHLRSSSVWSELQILNISSRQVSARPYTAS